MIEPPKPEVPKKEKKKIVNNLASVIQQKNSSVDNNLLNELTPLEMKKYKTRIMLNEILASKNVVRKTISPA